MRAIELFAGVGGFRLGLEANGHEVIWANEWDKYAAQTYNKNFGGSIDQRDISKVPTSDIPDHDILVGGFPCQTFSVAGKRAGFDDTRGTMFFEIARILADKKPKYFILENVKGLLSHDTGRTFQTILGVLSDLGYGTQWQVLNSKDFGVPQNRERVIIVGHLRTEPRPQVFPLGDYDGEASELSGQYSNTLTTRYYGGQANGTYVIESELNAQTPRVERTPLKFLDRNQKNIEGDYAFTVDSMNTGGLKVDGRIRRLTPMECERLQGFPDNWTAGVSDSQRYKQMGNAVTVNVVTVVVDTLVATLPYAMTTKLAGDTDVNESK